MSDDEREMSEEEVEEEEQAVEELTTPETEAAEEPPAPEPEPEVEEEPEPPAPKAEEEPQSPARKMAPPEDSGPSEAELAMQRRREPQSSSGLDENAQELLEANRIEREGMEEEIRELRQRSEQRKKEREAEEKRMAQQRQEEEQRRKAEEDERRRVKDEEEQKRRSARAEKMAEFEKWKNPPQRNFIITKKADGGGAEEDEDERKDDRKSREQLEAEKKAIMSQRIHPLEISDFDEGKLADKAKELHNQIFRLESEKYDLEKRFKEQQYDMMELAERARQMNKVGKGGLRRIQLGQDESDQIQERFAGAPARVEMFSPFERQKDSRSYTDRRTLFVGPQYGYPAERIQPKRIVKWDEAGLPQYEDMEGVEQDAEEAVQEEE